MPDLASPNAPPADSWVIATRESRLALWQAEHVRNWMHGRFGVDVRLLGMTTRGDEILDRTLAKVGGKGLFVKELETALERGEAQLAVHSLKDVPMDLPEGFALAAVLEREDPRDAFVSTRFADFDTLPEDAVVGTSSLRRAAQLLALKPRLRIEPLRGNLDTRLRKLDEGGYDAIVLAAAGLVRLGLAERIRSRFDPETMIPAAGQGALAIETRADAEPLREMLQAAIHGPTWIAVHAERALARALGGSCSVPLAAHARAEGDALVLDVALGKTDDPGQPLLRTRVASRLDPSAGLPASQRVAEALGRAAAERLREQGADEYLRPA